MRQPRVARERDWERHRAVGAHLGLVGGQQARGGRANSEFEPAATGQLRFIRARCGPARQPVWAAMKKEEDRGNSLKHKQAMKRGRYIDTYIGKPQRKATAKLFCPALPYLLKLQVPVEGRGFTLSSYT